MGSCDRIKRRIYTKKWKGIFAIKGGEGRSLSVCGRSATKKIYLAIKITTNFTGPLCNEKGQKKENGTRLSTCKSVDGKKWISFILDHGHLG